MDEIAGSFFLIGRDGRVHEFGLRTRKETSTAKSQGEIRSESRNRKCLSHTSRVRPQSLAARNHSGM